MTAVSSKGHEQVLFVRNRVLLAEKVAKPVHYVPTSTSLTNSPASRGK
jgi:hypothetical protein